KIKVSYNTSKKLLSSFEKVTQSNILYSLHFLYFNPNFHPLPKTTPWQPESLFVPSHFYSSSLSPSHSLAISITHSLNPPRAPNPNNTTPFRSISTPSTTFR
ncbi:hypothetical protein RYX36_016715, partial [Vicia faba]